MTPTPDDTERADPANARLLLEETHGHYWVELDRENGLESADPTIADAQIGKDVTAVFWRSKSDGSKTLGSC